MSRARWLIIVAASLVVAALIAYVAGDDQTHSIGHDSPEEALAAAIGPERYAGDCSEARIAEDIFKGCTGLLEQTSTTRRYYVGGPGSEPQGWLLVTRQADGSWLVVDRGSLPGNPLTPTPGRLPTHDGN